VENGHQQPHPMQVDEFYTYASTTLYENAVDTYQYTQEEGFPSNPYDAMLSYKVNTQPVIAT
jgi:hypothetical protein